MNEASVIPTPTGASSEPSTDRPTSPNRPMTLPEVCERWGVHINTVKRYCRLGKLAAFKVGGKWRVYLRDVLRCEHECGNAAMKRVGRPRLAAKATPTNPPGRNA